MQVQLVIRNVDPLRFAGHQHHRNAGVRLSKRPFSFLVSAINISRDRAGNYLRRQVYPLCPNTSVMFIDRVGQHVWLLVHPKTLENSHEEDGRSPALL